MAHSCVVKTLTLGISLVAKHARNFGEKTVFWILKCFGLSKKVDDTIQTLSANQPLKSSRTLKQCQHLVFNGEKQMKLPIDIARIIFEKAKINCDNLALVCTNWRDMADDEQLYRSTYPPIANGPEAYEKILKKAYPDLQRVEIGEELLLPRWIHRCLKDSEDELMVTLITDRVKIIKTSGEIDIVFDSLNSVGKFFKKPVTDLETCFTTNSWPAALEAKRTPIKRHWSIIGKNSMHKNKEFSEQLALCGNRIARLMDTAISVLMVYARTGERVFVWDEQTEQFDMVRFGDEDKTNNCRLYLGFEPSGLVVHHNYDSAYRSIGVAPPGSPLVLGNAMGLNLRLS